MESVLKKSIALAILLTLNISFASNHHQHNKAVFVESRDILATIELKNFRQGMGKFNEMGLDIAGVDVKKNIADVVVNDSELNKLKELGFNVKVKMTKSIMRGPDQDYKNPAEIEAFMKDYAQRFPEISKLQVIGQSVEGRNIFALKISDSPAVRDTSEPTILFNSMHHAREVMSPEVSLDVIEYLLTNYSSNDKVKHWVDSNEIYVVPMLNVDGNNKVWSGSSMWRKNTRNGHGVDLNRNYPFSWGACNGSSRSTRSDTYRGPTPGSEPETQALMNLVKEVRPVFDISYHSYSELVLYPFGCRPNEADAAVVNIGKKLGQLLDYTAGTPWDLLYNADGGDIDWMYAKFQVLSYVLELNSRSEGFQPSYSRWRQKTVERNRVGWQHLLDRLEQSGFRGMVTNAPDLKAAGKIIITVLKDGKNYKTYNVNPDGTYHIVLDPGKYSLRFENGLRQSLTQDYEVKATRINLEAIEL
jgi:carboxypeptidase T